MLSLFRHTFVCDHPEAVPGCEKSLRELRRSERRQTQQEEKEEEEVETQQQVEHPRGEKEQKQGQ